MGKAYNQARPLNSSSNCTSGRCGAWCAPSLNLDLRWPTGECLLVHAPSAQGDSGVRLRGRQLALAPDAQLCGDGAAQDAVDDGRLDVHVAAAAELLELRRVQALVHLVDAAALAEEVHDPEGIIHDLALVKEVRLPRGGSQAPSALLVEAGAHGRVLQRRELALLRDAEHHLHLAAQAVLVHDPRSRHGAAQAELLALRRDERAVHRADAPTLAAAVDDPLGVVDDLGALEGSLGSWKRRHGCVLSGLRAGWAKQQVPGAL